MRFPVLYTLSTFVDLDDGGTDSPNTDHFQGGVVVWKEDEAIGVAATSDSEKADSESSSPIPTALGSKLDSRGEGVIYRQGHINFGHRRV